MGPLTSGLELFGKSVCVSKKVIVWLFVLKAFEFDEKTQKYSFNIIEKEKLHGKVIKGRSSKDVYKNFLSKTENKAVR